jgi:hypothetical protein
MAGVRSHCAENYQDEGRGGNDLKQKQRLLERKWGINLIERRFLSL